MAPSQSHSDGDGTFSLSDSIHHNNWVCEEVLIQLESVNCELEVYSLSHWVQHIRQQPKLLCDFWPVIKASSPATTLKFEMVKLKCFNKVGWKNTLLNLTDSRVTHSQKAETVEHGATICIASSLQLAIANDHLSNDIFLSWLVVSSSCCLFKLIQIVTLVIGADQEGSKTKRDSEALRSQNQKVLIQPVHSCHLSYHLLSPAPSHSDSAVPLLDDSWALACVLWLLLLCLLGWQTWLPSDTRPTACHVDCFLLSSEQWAVRRVCTAVKILRKLQKQKIQCHGNT